MKLSDLSVKGNLPLGLNQASTIVRCLNNAGH